MRKILSNYRYYVLAVLAAVAAIGILSEPLDGLQDGIWILILVSYKVIGFCAAGITIKLIRRWGKSGAIPELTDAVNNS